LCARIFSLILDATDAIPAGQMLRGLMTHIVDFAPLVPVVEAELQITVKIGKHLSVDDFKAFVLEITPLFGRAQSQPLVRLVLPLCEYFNAWELIYNCCNGALDLSNVRNWNLVTQGFDVMPQMKRLEYIAKFTKFVPGLLAATPPAAREFEHLATSFPVTSLAWFQTLPPEKANPLRVEMEKRITPRVFKVLEKRIAALKLDSTVMKPNAKTLSIALTFREDETSLPITLELRFSKIFPMEEVVPKTDIGDRSLGAACDASVRQAITANESIEAGVIAWHTFVVVRVRDSAPCTICYSYFDTHMKKPTVECATCGNAFHRGCIKRWTAKSFQPICPYCALPWRPKR
jgi:hypothetical protein